MSQHELPRAERMARTADLLDAAAGAAVGERRAALDEVVLLNRCVADSIAARYSGRGLTDDDLRQVAYEGLVKAVHRFTPADGRDLLSYAVPTIRGELRKHFRDHGWTVRPPRRVQELQQRLARADEALRQRLGRDPEVDELVAEVGVERADYDDAEQARGCFRADSLDRACAPGSPRPLAEVLPDPGDDTTAAEARVTLAPVVRELPARDQRIVYLRFYEELTQSEIGEELGITQVQVSRLLGGIYARLRAAVGENPGG